MRTAVDRFAPQSGNNSAAPISASERLRDSKRNVLHVFVWIGAVLVFDIFAVRLETIVSVRVAFAPYSFSRLERLVFALADVGFEIFFDAGVGRMPFVHGTIVYSKWDVVC